MRGARRDCAGKVRLLHMAEQTNVQAPRHPWGRPPKTAPSTTHGLAQASQERCMVYS